MFRKKLNSIRSIHKELKARKYLNSKYVPPINRIDTSSITLFIENNGYVNLEEFINYFSQRIFVEEILYNIIFNLIDAIYHLHINGIIHLDLKPSNILIDEDINVKIVDFENFLKVGKHNGPFPKAEGNFLYRAPERDTSSYGTESNIFSLGLLVYYIIHGSHPYFGLSQSEIIEWKNTWKIEYSPIINPLVKYFIECCINPNPNERFVLNLRGHIGYQRFISPYGADETYAYVLMHSNIILLNTDSIACDDKSEFLNNIDIFIYHPSANVPLTFCQQFIDLLKPYSTYDNIPLDDFFCEFTILESFFLSSRVALDQYELENYFSCRGLSHFPMNFFEMKFQIFDDVDDFYKYRSIQEFVGVVVPVDIIEGTYHLLKEFDTFNHCNLSLYILVQPTIMAFFPDACDLLCLDFKWFADTLFPLFRTFVFNSKALNLNEVILTQANIIESCGTMSFLECACRLLHHDFYLNNHPLKILSFSKTKGWMKLLEVNLRPELYNYYSVYKSFFNLLSGRKYNEDSFLIRSQANEMLLKNMVVGIQEYSSNYASNLLDLRTL